MIDPEHPSEEIRLVPPVTPGNSHVDWIVKVASAGLITLLTFFAARDRLGVDNHIGAMETKVDGIQAQTQDNKEQIAVIKSKQDRVLADLAENGRKLDVVISELRRK